MGDDMVDRSTNTSQGTPDVTERLASFPPSPELGLLGSRHAPATNAFHEPSLR